MKRIIVFFLLFSLAPVLSSAMEITSPFGWRTHPITGVQRFHSGVDIAGDYGDAIPAVLGGIASVGFDPGGYGNYVQVDHPDGTVTLYGHCQALYVVDGQSVQVGQIIAAVGSTGGSTGPHVHVEYRVDGRPSDPMSILLAAGWDLTYGVGDGTGHPDADEMPWDFGTFYDLAVQLRTFLNEISKQCTIGLSLIQNDCMSFLKILMTIDFAIACVLFLLQDEAGDWTRLFVQKVLQYGFIVYLIGNWSEFVNSFVLDQFTHYSIVAGGGGAYIADNISDPAKIIQKGVSFVQPIFDYISTFSGAHLLANIHLILIAMVIGLAILTCFIIVGIQFFIVYLQFYILCTISIVLIPFGVVKQVKFLGENGISSVINAGIKLMIMILNVSLIVYSIKDVTPGAYELDLYLNVLLLSLLLVYLTSKASDGLKLLSSSPKL